MLSRLPASVERYALLSLMPPQKPFLFFCRGSLSVLFYFCESWLYEYGYVEYCCSEYCSGLQVGRRCRPEPGATKQIRAANSETRDMPNNPKP